MGLLGIGPRGGAFVSLFLPPPPPVGSVIGEMGGWSVLSFCVPWGCFFAVRRAPPNQSINACISSKSKRTEGVWEGRKGSGMGGAIWSLNHHESPDFLCMCALS